MTANATNDLTFTQAAAALGMVPASFSTFVKSKGVAGRKSPHHRHAKLISRAELEGLLGYKLTDAQIEAATASKKAAHQPLNPECVDRGLIRFGSDLRDDQWQRHLLAHRLDHVIAPPFDNDLQMTGLDQHLYTRAQVDELLNGAIIQRDRQWEAWANDPLIRAAHPFAPPTLDFQWPTPPEE